jgi:hypothetical protein
MIAKAIKGRGFRGVLNYDLNQEKGVMLDTNMAGENARELAQEFGVIRQLRPNLNKAVLHVSLSAAEGEKLTDEQWREIGQAYLKGMDLDNNQFVMTRHTDTDHEHIHLIANRIKFNGEVTSDSQDYKRQEVIMRQIEKDYGLQAVAPSKDAERRAPTKGEVEREKRTGEVSTKQLLQRLADAAATDSKNYFEYTRKLKAAGVELIPITQLEGTKLSGLSYKLDGVIMKGSDLGKAYSPAGLAKRGVVYEKELNTRELLDLPRKEVIKTRPDLEDTFKMIERELEFKKIIFKESDVLEKIMAEYKDKLSFKIDAGDIPKIEIKIENKKDLSR